MNFLKLVRQSCCCLRVIALVKSTLWRSLSLHSPSPPFRSAELLLYHCWSCSNVLLHEDTQICIHKTVPQYHTQANFPILFPGLFFSLAEINIWLSFLLYDIRVYCIAFLYHKIWTRVFVFAHHFGPYNYMVHGKHSQLLIKYKNLKVTIIIHLFDHVSFLSPL